MKRIFCVLAIILFSGCMNVYTGIAPAKEKNTYYITGVKKDCIGLFWSGPYIWKFYRENNGEWTMINREKIMKGKIRPIQTQK